MPRHILPAAGLIVVLGGCTASSPDARIQEAETLVEQHLGHKPDWSVPWDERPEQPQSLLRLDDAVDSALRNNRELRTDMEMIAQADADLLQAGLLSNPVVNFMVMFPDGGGRSMLRGNGLPMQALQDLWLIPERKRVAHAELQQAILRLADRAVRLAADIKKVYARLQYLQRAIELTRENMGIVEQSTRLIRGRQRAGTSTQTEVNLSEIRHLRLRSELMTMEAERRSGQRELLMLMGSASAGDDWHVEPIVETTSLTEAGWEEVDLLSTAVEQRLDLKAAQWQVQAAEHGIELMKREGWPDLAVGLGLERSPAPQSNNPSWAGQAGNTAARGLADRAMGMPSPVMLPNALNPKEREVKWTLGPMVELEVPIFDWNQGRIARAVHEYRQRIAEYESRLQEMTRMVRDRLVMLRLASEQVDFYRQSILPAVERNLDLARRSFVGGQENLTVYLEVQEDLLMTRLRVLEFVRDYLVNRAELEREIGGRMPETAPTTQPGATSRPAESGSPAQVPQPS